MEIYNITPPLRKNQCNELKDKRKYFKGVEPFVCVRRSSVLGLELGL